MEVKNYTLHGDKANKDFDLVVYGSKGRPAIAFPEGDSDYGDGRASCRERV